MAFVINPMTGLLDIVTGVGDTVTGGTEGSVLFIGPSSTLAQDNTNFFWDDTNNELRLGNASTQNGKLISQSEAADTRNIYLTTPSGGFGVSYGSHTSMSANVVGANTGTPPLDLRAGQFIVTNTNTMSSAVDDDIWSHIGIFSNVVISGNVSSTALNLNEVNTGFSYAVTRSGVITATEFSIANYATSGTVNRAKIYNNVSGSYLEANYGHRSVITGGVTLINGTLVANSYGFYASITGTVPGTSTNYGLYIDAVSGAATNWAIYSNTTASSYFAGNVGINETPSVRLHVKETNSAASSAVIFQGYSGGGLATKEVVRINNENGDKMVAMSGSNLAGAGDYGSLNLYGTATAAQDLYSFGDFTWVNISGEGSEDLRMGNLRIYRNGAWNQGSFQIVLRNGGSFTVPMNSQYSSETAFGNNSSNFTAQVTVTPWDNFLTGLLVQAPAGGMGANYIEVRDHTTALLLSVAASGELSFDTNVTPTAANQLSRNGSTLFFHDGTDARSLFNKLRKNSAGTIFSRPQINLIEGTNITLTVADDGVNNEIDVTISASGGGSGLTHGEVMTRISIGI
jgi:hypothetical protein